MKRLAAKKDGIPEESAGDFYRILQVFFKEPHMSRICVTVPYL